MVHTLPFVVVAFALGVCVGFLWRRPAFRGTADRLPLEVRRTLGWYQSNDPAMRSLPLRAFERHRAMIRRHTGIDITEPLPGCAVHLPDLPRVEAA